MSRLVRVAATVAFVTIVASCSSAPTRTVTGGGIGGTPATAAATAPAPPTGATDEALAVGEYAWTQLGSGSRVEVRTVADGSCPTATVDDHAVPMSVFQPATAAFPHATCVAELPAGARAVAVGDHRLPSPPTRLERIAVVGDIGCYLKTTKQQDCLNGFPARQIAERIATEKPDLVVFVGDIYYSQDECEDAAKCQGVPVGDRWKTWAYDFFDPYRSALATAPWIFARGNHESCDTKDDDGGPGWFQILAPEAGPCDNYTDPYRVDVVDQSFVVFDSALADDNPSQHADRYEPELAKVHELTTGHPDAWFVDHRPLWATTGPKPSDTLNATLQQAIHDSGDTLPSDVALILSGHVHALGAFTFGDGRPPQVVSGGGGTELDSSKAGNYAGLPIDGTTFAMGQLEADWGFVRMDRAARGWGVTYEQYAEGAWSTWLSCSFAARALACPS